MDVLNKNGENVGLSGDSDSDSDCDDSNSEGSTSSLEGDSGSEEESDEEGEDEDDDETFGASLNILPSYVWKSKEDGMRALSGKSAGTYVVVKDEDLLRIEYMKQSTQGSSIKIVGLDVLRTGDGQLKLNSKKLATAGPFRSLDELLEANNDRLIAGINPPAELPDYGEYGGWID